MSRLLCSGFGITRSETIRPICLIASLNWPDLRYFQPTLRCNTNQDLEKVEEYLRVIQERILAPIRETEIHHSCTATLLLLFSAIDGLGKLLHPNKKARCVKRISEFLDYMGGGYADHKTEL